MSGEEHLAQAIARTEVGDLVGRMRATADELDLGRVGVYELLVEAADVLWRTAVAGARARQAISSHRAHHLWNGGARDVDLKLWEAVADVAPTVIRGDG